MSDVFNIYMVAARHRPADLYLIAITFTSSPSYVAYKTRLSPIEYLQYKSITTHSLKYKILYFFSSNKRLNLRKDH